MDVNVELAKSVNAPKTGLPVIAVFILCENSTVNTPETFAGSVKNGEPNAVCLIEFPEIDGVEMTCQFVPPPVTATPLFWLGQSEGIDAPTVNPSNVCK